MPELSSCRVQLTFTFALLYELSVCSILPSVNLSADRIGSGVGTAAEGSATAEDGSTAVSPRRKARPVVYICKAEEQHRGKQDIQRE